MQFVEEGDDLAIRLLDLVKHSFEPLLELAAVFRPGDHRTEVERHNSLCLESLGDVTVGDATRQAFDDRSLADTGLTNQDRVVLGPAGQDLDHTTDLIVTTDDGVELAFSRDGGEIAAVLLESVQGGLGIIRGHPTATSDLLEHLENRRGGKARLAEQTPG